MCEGEPDCLAVLAVLAVLAARQTAGRGQFNRVWQAPEGDLNLSLLLQPGTPAREAPRWSPAIGAAVAEGLLPLN